MDGREFLALIDERISDGRRYPTLNEYKAALEELRARHQPDDDGSMARAAEAWRVRRVRPAGQPFPEPPPPIDRAKLDRLLDIANRPAPILSPADAGALLNRLDHLSREADDMPAGSRPYIKPRFRIEVLGQRFPKEEWSPLYGTDGLRYTFVDQAEADKALVKLRTVQPHATFRVAPMD